MAVNSICIIIISRLQDPAYPPVQPYQQPAGQFPYPQATGQSPYPTNSAYPPGQYDAPPSYYPPEKQPMTVQQQVL